MANESIRDELAKAMRGVKSVELPRIDCFSESDDPDNADVKDTLGLADAILAKFTVTRRGDDHAELNEKDARPHSRACGPSLHEHGLSCHTNCPTCNGRPVTRRNDDHAELIAQARNTGIAINVPVGESVAKEVKQVLDALADALEAATK